MLRNLDIFQLETLSHTTRRVVLANGGEAFPYSDLSVGRIEGLQRTIPALVSDGVTEGDNWYIVNLVDASNNMNRYVQTVAVLGATSADQAREWAFKNIGAFIGANDTWSTATTSTKALKTYLDRPSTSVAIIAIRQADLDTIAAQITDKPVVWDGSRLTSHDPSTLLHELVKHDDEVTMMDAMTPSDLPILMIEMGGEIAEYDALIVDYNRLDLLMQRLNTAMQKSSVGNVKPVNVTQSKPFKKNGVTNVAALFEMNDGQSVTIVFHSPDNTPAKLAPSDTLTSWKWMLNKRDISAAVSPKNGENVQMPDLAKRILTIVEKNSARFTRTNGNKAAQIQELTNTNTRIGQKQEALAGILAINKDLQKQIDEAGRQVVRPTAKEPEKPYSENIIAALVANHGWTASTNSSATKEFTGMAAGGELSDGTRMLTARFDDKGRYIGIDKDGFDSTPIPETDMDMRDYMTDAKGGAKAFNDMVEAYVAKQRDALKPSPVPTPTPAAKSKDLTDEEYAVLKKAYNEFKAKADKIGAAKSREDALKIAADLVTEMPEKEDQIHRAFSDAIRDNKWGGFEISFPKQPVKVGTDIEINRTLKRLQKALEGTEYSIHGVFKNKFANLEFAYGKGFTGKFHVASIEKRDDKFFNYDRTVSNWQTEELIKPLMDATVNWLNGETIPKMMIGNDDHWYANGSTLSTTIYNAFNEAKAKAAPVTQPEPTPATVQAESTDEGYMTASNGTQYKFEIRPYNNGFGVFVKSKHADGKEIDNLYSSEKTEEDAQMAVNKAKNLYFDTPLPDGIYRQGTFNGKKYEGLSESTAKIEAKKRNNGIDAGSEWVVVEDSGNKGKFAIELRQEVKAEQPANEPPMTNPDRDYLQSIIDGKVDPLTVDMDAVIALAEKYDGDAEMTPLLDQALEVINQAEQEAAKGI